MKKKQNFEKCCSLCEHSEEIFGGEYFICKKKGIVEPDGLCSAFCFDPLMIKVSVRKIPEFKPIPVTVPDNEKKETK